MTLILGKSRNVNVALKLVCPNQSNNLLIRLKIHLNIRKETFLYSVLLTLM